MNAGEVTFTRERPRGLCTIRQPVTITGTDGVQGGLSPVRFEESQAEQRPDDHDSDGEGTREQGELVLDID